MSRAVLRPPGDMRRWDGKQRAHRAGTGYKSPIATDGLMCCNRGTMPFPPDARAKIREKIANRRLPTKRPAKMWAGNGNGETCAGCDEPITPDQIEYEFTDGVAIRMHIGCAALWDAERRRASA